MSALMVLLCTTTTTSEDSALQEALRALDFGATQVERARIGGPRAQEALRAWLLSESSVAKIEVVLVHITGRDRWAIPALEEIIEGKTAIGENTEVAASVFWNSFPTDAVIPSRRAVANLPDSNLRNELASFLAASGNTSPEVESNLKLRCDSAMQPTTEPELPLWGIVIPMVHQPGQDIRIAHVCKNSIAESRGLRRGDIITAIGSARGRQVVARIFEPERRLTITVARKSSAMTFTLER